MIAISSDRDRGQLNLLGETWYAQYTAGRGIDEQMILIAANSPYSFLGPDWEPVLRERAEELVALATEQGFPHFVGSGTCFLGWATLAVGGSIEEAISRMRWGLATKRATGAEIKVPYYLGLLAEAHRRANRTADAISLLKEALELVERTDERWYEAELYRLSAEALIANSDRHDAERYLWRALRTAQTQGARLWELRAATSTARLWRDQGRRTEARDLLAPIYRWFTEGFDTRDLKEANVLLAELA